MDAGSFLCPANNSYVLKGKQVSPTRMIIRAIIDYCDQKSLDMIHPQMKCKSKDEADAILPYI